ncbi:hypothetical protein RB595_002223 [Gaeumannomyces hyphopodioides]
MDLPQNQWQHQPQPPQPRSPSQDSVLTPVSPYNRADAEQIGLMSSRRIPTPSISTLHDDGDDMYQDPIWMTPSPRETTPRPAAPLRRLSADLGVSPLTPSYGDTLSVEKLPPLSKPLAPAPTESGRRRGHPKSSWWWWEILACALGLVSTVLLFVLLAHVEGIALESWPHPIQINSVIAVLTAVARTAMVVPLAACISQLKWSHFERPSRLGHLQDYDNASRGPWGSLLILFNLKVGDWLVWVLALWTVASLGISPSAQQILEFPSRRVALRNTTATIVQAPGYWAKEAFQMYPSGVAGETNADRFFFPPSVALPFQIKLRTGLLGGSFTPDFSCPPPASECEWADFSTLGLCADVRNVTADTKVSCKLQQSQQGVACEYTHDSVKGDPRLPMRMVYRNDDFDRRLPEPSFVVVSSARPTTTASKSGPSAKTRSSPSLSERSPGVVVATDTQTDKRQLENFMMASESLQSSKYGLAVRIRGDVFDADSLSRKSDTYIRQDRPPPVDVFDYSWQWCEKTLRNVSARGGELHIGDIQVEPLPAVTVQGDTVTIHGQSDDNMNIYSGKTTEARYMVGHMSHTRLKLVRELFFDQDVFSRDGGGETTSNTKDGLLDFGMFIYQSNLTDLARRHAVTVDNLLHSRASNANATVREGTAFVVETYVRVRWAWILLPVIEAIGTAALLATSIVLTRRRPLLKDSALALLFYGPGWDGLPDADWGQEVGGWASADASALKGSANGLMASIEVDREGRPGFVTSVETQGR